LSLLRFRYMRWYKHITLWTHMLSITNTKTFKMWSTHPYKILSNPSRLSQNWPSWAFWPLKSTKFENPFWKIVRSPYSRNGFTYHCQTWQGDAYCHLDRADHQNFEIYKSRMVAVAILTKKIEKPLVWLIFIIVHF